MDVPTDAILVSQSLRALIADGAIGAVKPVLADQVQPSSLDLRVGARIWQLQCSFLPGRDGVVRKLGRLATAEWRTDRDRPLVLHRGGVYLAEVEEVLELPEQVWGRGNPKSSTGRLDVFVRLLTEFGEAFDTVPPGYQGRLYLEITPQSFHIGVRRGDRLGQIRLGSGRPGLSAEALESKQAASPVVVWSDGSPAPVVDAARPGVLLSVDLEGVGGPVGYLARRHQPPVDPRGGLHLGALLPQGDERGLELDHLARAHKLPELHPVGHGEDGPGPVPPVQPHRVADELARQLRHGLQDQHARHHGEAGKVVLEEGL